MVRIAVQELKKGRCETLSETLQWANLEIAVSMVQVLVTMDRGNKAKYLFKFTESFTRLQGFVDVEIDSPRGTLRQTRATEGNPQ